MHLVAFKLEDGSDILVEVEGPRQDGPQPAGRVAEIADRATESFSEAMDKIKPAAEAIISKLRALSVSPDEVSVEFGVSLNAKAGAVLASAGGEAHYKIVLKWSQPSR